MAISRTLPAAVVVLLALTFGTGATRAQQIQDTKSPPDPIDFAMSFQSHVRDAPECHLTLSNGRFDFGASVTNPAVTCPDAFAWMLFTKIVQAGFWENWSTDRQTWPSDPWPRCAPGVDPKRCCTAVEISNNAAPEHCPVFPGPTPGVPLDQLQTPSTAHQMTMAAATGRHGTTWKDVPPIFRDAVIGAIQEELIFRNEPMVDYIYDNELYYTEGLARVFDTAKRTLEAYAPYQAEPIDPSVSHPVALPIAIISFPIEARMVKTDWLPVSEAPKYGIDPYDKANPYIIMNLMPKDGPASGKPQPYILLSFHISTKDLPNWFWSTFEHVDNQGRCDWIGCNDSFGYVVTQKIAIDASKAKGLAPVATTYVPPHTTGSVDSSDATGFDLAKRYTGVDRISDALASILNQAGIGTGSGINESGRPTRQDAAWRSYRLKGTQVDWVTSEGRPTLLGNSVTEAGFVNSASCITCHAQAAVNGKGLMIHAIFEDTLSDAGIPKSANGVVNQNLFHTNAFWGVGGQFESERLLGVQTDFVWGFRMACPMAPMPYGPKWCTNVTGPGYSSPVPTPATDTTH